MEELDNLRGQVLRRAHPFHYLHSRLTWFLLESGLCYFDEANLVHIGDGLPDGCPTPVYHPHLLLPHSADVVHRYFVDDYFVADADQLAAHPCDYVPQPLAVVGKQAPVHRLMWEQNMNGLLPMLLAHLLVQLLTEWLVGLQDKLVGQTRAPPERLGPVPFQFYLSLQ